jgi:hypothetical protein
MRLLKVKGVNFVHGGRENRWRGGTVTLTYQGPSVVMIVPRGDNIRWNLYYSFVFKDNKLLWMSQKKNKLLWIMMGNMGN